MRDLDTSGRHGGESTDSTDDQFPDHSRTARSHAGEGIQDGYNVPGILLFAFGIAALGMTLTAAAYGFTGWAIVAGVACAVGLLGGTGWLLLEHRRIKAKEGLALTDQMGH